MNTQQQPTSMESQYEVVWPLGRLRVEGGSDFPRAEDILSDVYYEVDRGTESGRTGKHFFSE